MICKWCGETLKRGDSTCRRCRKEVPAMSDCGGFYDLVPQAGAGVVQPVVSGEASAPVNQVPVRPIAPVLPDARGERIAKRKNLILLVAVLVAAFFLVQTIILNGKLSDAEAQLERYASRDDERDDKEEEKPGEDDGNGKEDKPGENEDPGLPGGNGEEDPKPTDTPQDPTEEPTEDPKPTEEPDEKVVEKVFEKLEPEVKIELTEERQAQLRNGEGLYFVLQDKNGDDTIGLYIYMDLETEELHLWVVEGADEYAFRMEWADKNGVCKSSEMEYREETPLPGEGADWDKDEVPEYSGVKMNFSNYMENTELHCYITCVDGDETVNITVDGVMLP